MRGSRIRTYGVLSGFPSSVQKTGAPTLIPFATLECELLDQKPLRSQAEARMAVFDFIEEAG